LLPAGASASTPDDELGRPIQICLLDHVVPTFRMNEHLDPRVLSTPLVDVRVAGIVRELNRIPSRE
jgi:hypothetical protein